MSRIFVAGLGAVSPAGWNVAALRDALDKNEPLPVQSLERPGWKNPLPARLVPNPPVRPEFLSHPRLRRTSPITHYAAPPRSKPWPDCAPIPPQKISGSASSSACNPAACNTPAGFTTKL